MPYCVCLVWLGLIVCNLKCSVLALPFTRCWTKSKIISVAKYPFNRRFSACRGARSIKWCFHVVTISSTFFFFGFVFKLSHNQTKVPLGNDDFAMWFQKQYQQKIVGNVSPIFWIQPFSFPQFTAVKPCIPHEERCFPRCVNK